MEEDYRLPPGIMFRSFLLVAGSYTLLFLFFAISLSTISMLFFPDTYQALVEDKFRDEPTRYFVPGLFWSVLAINTLVSLGMGWLIVRGAQFARFPHAVFLSVLLFISYLQNVMATPDDGKWMYLIFMVCFPVAILLAANKSAMSLARREDAEQGGS